MWNKPEFRMPDGAEIVSRQGDSFEMQISIPTDDDGFFGRECPECALSFRMNGEDYDTLPDDLTLWCVYCGHDAEHSEFMTSQQRGRIMRAVEDYATQMISNELGQAFRGLGRGSSGIDEERLVRVRKCGQCHVRYAVFGEHRYCPVCGKLPAATVAFDALQADKTRLDALSDLPSGTVDLLREQGVFTRLWVDTIENVVGVVEALASSVFRAAVTDADVRLQGKGNIFQRLEDTADLFVAAGYDDLRTELGLETWQRLTETWAARHLFTHNDGVVDQKYLAKVPSSSARVGQRLVVSEAICGQAIDDTTALCEALVDLTS